MGRELEQTVVALPEGEEHSPVVLGEVPGQAALDAAEDRLALSVGPDQDERVVGDADERRGEDGQERLVVVAVVEQPEVRKKVDDLLLSEIAATGGPVGGQTERARAPPRTTRRRSRPRREGRSRLVTPRRHRRARARARDVPRLGTAPVDTGLAGGRLVRDEQLHWRSEAPAGPQPPAGSRRWNSSPNSAANSSFTASSTSGRERWFCVSGSTVGAAARRSRKTATSAWRKP